MNRMQKNNIHDFLSGPQTKSRHWQTKTGSPQQADTKNTINPALHVGVPAFRGTRNTKIDQVVSN